MKDNPPGLCERMVIKMTFITLISIVLFACLLAVTVILRSVNKKKLDSIRGFGGVFKKGVQKGILISKSQND